MRIAYVINSVEGGGAALPVPAIAQVLRDQGAEVRVFALTGRDRRALPPMQAADLDPLIRDGGEKDHIAAARWFSREVRKWQATHIWTSLSRATILGLLIGPALGLPVISWQHNEFLKPWNERLLRLLQSRAALWVCDSRSVADLTVDRLRVDPERVATWPIYFADRSMPEARSWQAGETICIGSLGRLHPAKGYDILIAALARMRADGFTPPVPIEIVIAGEGEERLRLEALAREAAIDNLSFVGYTENTRDFLSGLHLYVQPSRREGFCIAAHEAMTAGLPVIASDVGELHFSIQEGKTGWVVPAASPPHLADCLAAAIGEPGRLHMMGTAARADMLERYSQARFEQAGAEIVALLR
ncbi:MAG: glycosyltransferase family 4 protein [Sphingobium sp.]